MLAFFYTDLLTSVIQTKICNKFISFPHFQCLYKTQGTRRRQWPPSREEIMCTINRRPIYARFHFMDGQYHAVEFHPSATAKDVMELVKAKIGLRESAMGEDFSVIVFVG